MGSFDHFNSRTLTVAAGQHRLQTIIHAGNGGHIEDIPRWAARVPDFAINQQYVWPWRYAYTIFEHSKSGIINFAQINIDRAVKTQPEITGDDR